MSRSHPSTFAQTVKRPLDARLQTLDFTYLFDTETDDFRTMGEGVQIRDEGRATSESPALRDVRMAKGRPEIALISEYDLLRQALSRS